MDRYKQYKNCTLKKKAQKFHFLWPDRFNGAGINGGDQFHGDSGCAVGYVVVGIGGGPS